MPRMTNDEIKSALSQKITTRDAFYDLIKSAGLCDSYYMDRPVGFGYKYVEDGTNVMGFNLDHVELPTLSSIDRTIYDQWRNERTNAVPHHLWWLVREKMRLLYGVYPEYTTVLQAIAIKHHVRNMVPHISVDDPTMIAYTASSADGEADRQIRTTLGKFLKKHFFTLTDEDIQAIDASHRADMSAELELLTGAADILKVYTSMPGDSGCMRYNSAHFGLPRGKHPSNVYDAPGFAAAVMRDGAGTIKARAMTWTNPADPTDKRYIRIYGDSALKRRLERNGFVLKDFRGAALKRIDLDSEGVGDGLMRVVMPYIDGPGGNLSDPRMNGRYGVLTPDGVRLLSREERDELVSAMPDDGYVCPQLTGTGGSILMRAVSGDWRMYTCAASGQQFDRFTTPAVKLLLADGTLAEGNEAAAIAAGFVPRRYFSPSSVLAHPSIGTFDTGPYNTGIADVPATREWYGMVRLDAEFYPDEQEWVTQTDDLVRANDRWYKKADLVRFVNAEGAVDRVHKSTVPADAVKLWRFEGGAVFAAKGVTFYTTRSGCKVHPSVHEVVKLYDGTFEFERNVTYLRVFGINTRVHRELARPIDVDVTKHTTLLANFEDFATRPDLEYGTRLMRSCLAYDLGSRVLSEDGVVGVGPVSSAIGNFNDPVKVRQVIAAVEAADDTALAGVDVTYTRWWARSVKFLLDHFDAKRAEAQATRATVAAPTPPQGESRFATARFSLAA